MQIADIYSYFQNPPSTHICKEAAVSYVVWTLKTREESYGTELIQLMEQQYENLRISDTVLYAALKFLEEEELVSSYWQKLEGRGRPRRMYRLNPEKASQAQELAALWEDYSATKALATNASDLTNCSA